MMDASVVVLCKANCSLYQCLSLAYTRNTQAKYASRNFICIICAGWVLVNCGLYLSLMHAGLKYRCSLRCGES